MALKVIHAQLARQPAYLERFQREASLASAIDHPNVIRIFEIGRDGETHILHQVCLGLQAAHQGGVEVHRDIKPQNILVAPDGTMKLTDFGIARAADLSAMTATGAIMGTPHYMSPEQSQGERADIRTDVYALGIVLYQMLTGELPFNAETPMAVLRMHREDSPKHLRELRADVPPEVDAIVERCLEKDPERRYQTPADLAQALEQAVPGSIPATPEPQMLSQPTPPAPQPPAPAIPPTVPPPPVSQARLLRQRRRHRHQVRAQRLSRRPHRLQS